MPLGLLLIIVGIWIVVNTFNHNLISLLHGKETGVTIDITPPTNKMPVIKSDRG